MMGDLRTRLPLLQCSQAAARCALLPLSLFLCGALAAQSLGDSIAAAANGSVAGVAGKPLSEGIGKIFRKVDRQQQEATLEERKPRQEILSPAEDPARVSPTARAAGEGGAPADPGFPRRSAAYDETAAAARPPAGLQEGFLLPPPKQINAGDLSAIAAGTTRQELSTKLGRPSARVLIPADGELHEVYLFTSGGKPLGRIELAGGEVTAVVAQP